LIPRDLSGRELAGLLRRYGFEQTRQTGSHMRLSSSFTGAECHVTIPAHRALRVGTLHSILTDVAVYLHIDRTTLVEELFER
jgi:predicted RNA binding protein YcfA (HicA-like mRNA interferase family)